MKKIISLLIVICMFISTNAIDNSDYDNIIKIQNSQNILIDL